MPLGIKKCQHLYGSTFTILRLETDRNCLPHESWYIIKLTDQTKPIVYLAHSVRAEEYPEYISAEGQVSIPLNECPRYDTKQSDGVAPVMLVLWGIRSTPLLPSHPGPILPGVLASDSVLSVGQIEVIDIQTVHMLNWNRSVLTFNCVSTKNCIYVKLNCLK